MTAETSSTTTRFAAYDESDRVIWGIGDSEESAIADARDWHSRNGDPDESWDELSTRLNVEPCDHGLANDVANCGGQVQWQWAGTADERYMTQKAWALNHNPHHTEKTSELFPFFFL